MPESILNAYTVIIILFIGYFLKRLNLLNIDCVKRLSTVVLYLTMPCTLLSGTSGEMEFDYALLFLLPLSFLCGFFMLFIGYVSYKTPQRRVFAMLNLCGSNIGNFVLPFMQSILTPAAFVALCIYDVVNALFCFGGAYCLALWFNRKGFHGEQISLCKIAKKMATSVPSYCCIVAVVLGALNMTLPPEILHPLKTIGRSNTFLCMLVIGVALSFNINFKQIKNILGVLGLRYFASFILCLGIYYLLPFSLDVRLIMMVMILAPITTLAPIMCIKSIPEFAEESADLNMISLLLSMVLITALNACVPMLS